MQTNVALLRTSYKKKNHMSDPNLRIINEKKEKPTASNTRNMFWNVERVLNHFLSFF